MTLGALHLAMAIIAMISGGAVSLMRSKGSVAHRRVGWVYVGSMIGLNVTAFWIYRLFGGFGLFHAAAIVSLLTVLFGMIPVLTRRPKKWLEHHAYWMSWSYVGLLAAAAAETTSRVPRSPFWWMVAGSTLLVVAIGSRIIRAKLPPAIRRLS